MQLAKKGSGDQKIPEKVMWALIDAIESILNDKRDYADARLLQEM